MISLSRAGRPVVSVVMVTYGGGEWAERALAALRDGTEIPYEVILVDNASPDGTGDRIERAVSGVTLLRNERNVGFAAASNRGAAHARGAVLCFLNPDALVERGWTAPLLRRLDDDPAVAAVVPRLLNLDGSLQEAGSLVGRDGATWALGHDVGDPDDPRFRFPLEVDFGSACLLVRRSAFCEVGGFDAAFQPAYGEDVDLCLALQARGYRVLYEPGATVRHERSVSAGVGGAGRWILENRRLLANRWSGWLRERPWLEEPAYFPHRVAAVRDHRMLHRVLLVADELDGEPAAVALEAAARCPDALVTVVVARPLQPGTAAALSERGVEVVAAPRDPEAWFEAQRFLASVVIVGTSRFDDLLASSQPQAPRVPLRAVVRDADAALRSAGVAVAGAFP